MLYNKLDVRWLLKKINIDHGTYISKTLLAYLPDERIEEDPSSSVPVHLFPLPPTQGWNHVIILQWKTEKISPKFEIGP